MRYLYSALLYLLFPLLLLRMLLRSLRAPDYRHRLLERLGICNPGFEMDSPVIWVHAVSVGEVQAAAPLVEAMLRRFPDHELLLTTTTPTGSERVHALFGSRVYHVYCPWDLPGAVRRFMSRVQPRLLVLVETELWPNILHRAAGQGCRVLLANARLSERSARGYARIGPLTRQMLGHLDRVACQGEGDAVRFLALGLPRDALRVTGNLKFDLEIDDGMRELVSRLRRGVGEPSPPVVLAASTHPGEDEQVLAAFRILRRSEPGCRLMLAPRHPERFEDVCSMSRDAGWKVSRRSEGAGPGPGTDVLLCDTMGELPALFGVATVAVIGGSLVPNGGHNPLEAAIWGVPVLSGPSMFNFEGVSARLLLAGAMIRLEAPEDLAASLESLLRDPDACRTMGQAGQRVVEQNRGVAGRLLDLVVAELAAVESVAREPAEA